MKDNGIKTEVEVEFNKVPLILEGLRNESSNSEDAKEFVSNIKGNYVKFKLKLYEDGSKKIENLLTQEEIKVSEDWNVGIDEFDSLINAKKRGGKPKRKTKKSKKQPKKGRKSRKTKNQKK